MRNGPLGARHDRSHEASWWSDAMAKALQGRTHTISGTAFDNGIAAVRPRSGQFANSSPEMKAWFDALKSGRGLCCSDADGVVVSDGDWDTKDGRYRVRLDGEWADVPDDAVVKEPNRAGRAMVWSMPFRAEDDAITIRCFMPGSMS